MAFVSKKNYSNRTYTGQVMRSQAGWREKDIMDNASFVVSNKKNGTVKFYKKHRKVDSKDFTNYSTATYALSRHGRRGGWIG